MYPFMTYLPIFFSLSAGVKDCVLCFEHALRRSRWRPDVMTYYIICVFEVDIFIVDVVRWLLVLLFYIKKFFKVKS